MVVTSTSFVAGSTLRVSLDTGRSLVIDQNRTERLGGGTPNEGDLLFYGTVPEPWSLTLRPGDGSERCPLGGLATDHGDEFLFDSGLVIPKAPDFDRGSGNFRRPGGSHFCVNDTGELTRLYE